MHRFPPYPSRPHRSGQARIKLGGRHVYLGVHGSEASWAEYERRLARWRADASSVDRKGRSTDVPARTVADLVAAYLDHLERRGRPRELEILRPVLAPLVRLLGHLPLVDLRPKALRDALAVAASGEWMTPEERAARQAGGRRCVWGAGYARRALARWRAAVAWAEGEELIPLGTLARIAAARPPRAEEEGEDVQPAPEESIQAALPRLNRIVRALVECLLLTGARPGELCRLTPGDIVRGGEVEVARGWRVKLGPSVWAYVPARHKMRHKGRHRVILIGPRAQAVLAPLLEGRPADRPVFCPQEATNRPAGGGKPPKLHYDRYALRQAIERACARAGVPPFTSYQLRHNAASRLASEFSPEVARIVLGHKDLRVTSIYIRDDLGKAVEAMERAG